MVETQNPLGAGLFLTLRSSLKQTWYRTIRQCYIPTLKKTELSDYEKNIFECGFFLCFSLVQTQDPPGAEPFEIHGNHLNKLRKGPLGKNISNFQHGQVILKKKISKYFLWIFITESPESKFDLAKCMSRSIQYQH